MAADIQLKAAPRAERGKGAARKLRAAGRVPAVIYGHGEETRALTVDAHELSRLLARVHVENTILDIDIEGQGEVRALVREIQTHAYRDDVVHIDFYLVHAGEMLTVSVPLRFIGSAPGVKNGGMLQHTLDEFEVRCLPAAIPEFLEVDISGLEIGDSVHVSQIAVPENVEVLEDPDRTVCSLLPPTVSAVAEDEEAEEATPGQPELVRRREEADED
jgi:large subunit ribosomal protein L25